MNLTPDQRLLYDGLIYFVALTGTFLWSAVNPHPTAPHIAVNIMNIVLYRRGSAYQKIGYLFSIPKPSARILPCVPYSAPLGFAIITIMSQRILLHARGTYPTTLIAGLMTK